MKVSQLMTPDPVTATPDLNVAAAAALMLSADCGILPVVKNGRLSGVVTDRDLFIALGTRDQKPSALTVGDVMSGVLYTCSPEDDVDAPDCSSIPVGGPADDARRGAGVCDPDPQPQL